MAARTAKKPPKGSTFTFIETADWHVDDGANSTKDPATGHPVAWLSHLKVADFIVATAIERGVDALVIAGDLTKNGRPTQEALLLLRETLKPLAGTGIDLLLLGGNHESLNIPRGDRTVVETLASLLEGDGVLVHVVERNAAMVPIKGVQFLALPWLSKASVVAAEDAHGLTPSETDNLVIHRAVSQMDDLMAERDESMPTVFTSHLTVEDLQIGAVTEGHHRGSEMDLASVFSEPVMPRATIDEYGFAHAGLGHIHPRQRIGRSTFYVGSPDRLTFADAADDKGVNLVTIDTATGEMTGFEMIETPARTMSTLDVTDDEAVAAIESLAEGTLFKVTLPHDATAVPEHVRDAIEAIRGVIVSTTRALPPRQTIERATISESATMSDALRAWVADVAPERADQMDSLITKAQALADAASTEEN